MSTRALTTSGCAPAAPSRPARAATTPPTMVRLATPRDAGFLADMLVEAVNWNPARPRLTRQEILATPQLHHYVAGWPRPGDTGLVATDRDGTPLGAAWLRSFTAADPGYGFVDDATPELSIGVHPDHRGRGIGRLLCAALLDRVMVSGRQHVSLSVEKANRAIHLYRQLGFRDHADDGDALVMLWTPPDSAVE